MSLSSEPLHLAVASAVIEWLHTKLLVRTLALVIGVIAMKAPIVAWIRPETF
jgi:hypothetical protein